MRLSGKSFLRAMVVCGLSGLPGVLHALPAWYVEQSMGTVGTNASSFPVGLNGQMEYQCAALGGTNLIFSAENKMYRCELNGTVITNWDIGTSLEGLVTHSNAIYALDAQGYKKWSPNGGLLFSKSIGLLLKDIVVDGAGFVYVYCSVDQLIRVYDPTGALVRSWGGSGTGNGQFSGSSYAMGLDGDLIVVFDAPSLNRLQWFTTAGDFVRSVSVSFGNSVDNIAATGDGYIVLFDNTSGRNLVMDPRTGQSASACAAADVLEAVFVGDAAYGISQQPGRFYGPIVKLVRGNRVMGTSTNPPPRPKITGISRRSNSSVVDIDYSVADTQPTTVGIVGQIAGATGLPGVVKMNTFVEGTATNRGPNIPPNVTRRLSWNAAVDLPPTNYVNIRFNLMAKDDRGILGFHFVTVPTNGPAGYRIDASPLVATDDLLRTWCWLVATNDPAITLSGGTIVGSTGVYSGQLLATGTVTTAMGRQFLFERMGVREATSNEVIRAFQGATPGITNRFAARNMVGNVPTNINEVGFDTGTLYRPTNSAAAVWVAPLP